MSPTAWLDWRTVDPLAHVRFLTFPAARLAGWTPPYAQDHTGKNPGGVVRMPFNVSTPTTYQFGQKS